MKFVIPLFSLMQFQVSSICTPEIPVKYFGYGGMGLVFLSDYSSTKISVQLTKNCNT